MLETKKCDGKPLEEVPKRGRSSQAPSPKLFFSSRREVKEKGFQGSKGEDEGFEGFEGSG